MDIDDTYNKALLGAGFTRPLVAVGLPLHEDQTGGFPGTVPPKTKGDRTLLFIEAAVVQFQLVVIQIYRVGKLRIALPRASLLKEDRQMLQHCVRTAYLTAETSSVLIQYLEVWRRKLWLSPPLSSAV